MVEVVLTVTEPPGFRELPAEMKAQFEPMYAEALRKLQEVAGPEAVVRLKRVWPMEER